MKRIFIILATIILLVPHVFANEHKIPFYGVTITIPDSYEYQSDLPERFYGMSSEAPFVESISNDFIVTHKEKTDVFVTLDFSAEMDRELDLRTCEDAKKEKFLNDTKKMHEYKNFKLVKTSEFETDYARFIKWYVYDGEKHWGILYNSVVSSYRIEFVAYFDRELTKEQELEFDNMVKSIHFDDTIKEKQSKRIEEEGKWDKYSEDTRQMQKAIELIVVPTFLAIVSVILILLVRKKRKNKEQDAIRSASVTRHCRSCGEPISESSEICPSCGTRQ